MNYRQLTLEQRYQIYALMKAGQTRIEISRIVGVDKSTISREFWRNSSKRGYRPRFAHRKSLERRSAKVKTHISSATWRGAKERLTDQQWSPEQISGRLALEGKATISHETIYQRIYKDKHMGGTLYKHLRCQKKRRKRYGSNDRRGGLVNQISIDERPLIVEEKTRIGDWELDTIIGKRHQQAIVSMTERKSKLLRIKKVSHKTGSLVGQAICRKLASLTVHTLTSDNGKEFAEHEVIARKLTADFYFCHPYTPWERGLNENTNGLIRQYFPKKTDLAMITTKQIKEVEDKLNNRPRKSLGYRTPNEVYFKELEQLRKVALTN
jgi:IS30 family transposase